MATPGPIHENPPMKYEITVPRIKRRVQCVPLDRVASMLFKAEECRPERLKGLLEREKQPSYMRESALEPIIALPDSFHVRPLSSGQIRILPESQEMTSNPLATVQFNRTPRTLVQ